MMMGGGKLDEVHTQIALLRQEIRALSHSGIDDALLKKKQADLEYWDKERNWLLARLDMLPEVDL